MIDNAEQKRLKKERKVLRITATIALKDDNNFEEWRKYLNQHMIDYFGPALEDISIFPGWKERK
jgi:hypothetical protein